MKVSELKNLQSEKTLIPELEIASTFFERGRGLLGRDNLKPTAGLWIPRCNSIHTFFMKFPIDCVFLNRKFQVTAIYENVKPWRFVGPVWRASSVIELKSGTAKDIGFKIGDQLNVGA